jgi:enterochelin esterase family protein
MNRQARHVIASMVLLASAASAAVAQQQPPVRSPEVHADGRVTVRLRAPNARAVTFASDGAPSAPMVRDSAGDWSYTTQPLAPDVYSYTFHVDGITIPDPQNAEMKPVFRMSLGQSVLHVPGPDSLSWEMRDVPRGTITEHFYTSRIIGDRRNYYVYTPPNYNPRRGERYPVLYLLHGLSDDASAWVRVGRANVILDNLIANRRATPMLVVMTLGYGAPEMMEGFYWGQEIDSAVWRRNTTRFTDALLTEVIPQVERQYHVATTATGRAIAGLSMGGGQSLYAGLNNPDRFAYIGAFSSVTTLNEQPYNTLYPAVDQGINSRVKLLWVGVGRDDFLRAENVRFRDWLRARNVSVEWAETAGGHTWMVWRRYLTDFLPRLFR